MRLGIYGGTFSPPHNGHIAAAQAFVDAVKPDKLLIIPTNIPPHKESLGTADAADRLNMCSIAFSGIKCAEISDMEIERGGRSYTYITLEELQSVSTDIYLLCGTDMLLTLDEWRNFERIFALATICYVRRETDADIDHLISDKIRLYEQKYGARVIKIDHTVIEMSSSEIRDAISDGCDGEGMLNAEVVRYIKERGLYQ